MNFTRREWLIWFTVSFCLIYALCVLTTCSNCLKSVIYLKWSRVYCDYVSYGSVIFCKVKCTLLHCNVFNSTMLYSLDICTVMYCVLIWPVVYELYESIRIIKCKTLLHKNSKLRVRIQNLEKNIFFSWQISQWVIYERNNFFPGLPALNPQKNSFFIYNNIYSFFK